MRWTSSLRISVLMLVLACCQVAPESSHADTTNVTCSPTTITSVNFAQISPSSTATVRVNGGVQFSCTNVSVLAAQSVTLCLGLGQGSGTSITPARQMSGPSSSTLAFQLYQDSSYTQVWGNVPSTSNPAPLVLKFTIPISILGIPAIYNSPAYPVYGSLVTPQPSAASGSYSNSLDGSLTYQANTKPLFGTSYPANCDGATSNGFSLPTLASVANQCTVSAGSPLILGGAGGVAAGTTNIAGSTTFSVTCTTGTLYNVGLSPSNNSMAGAGLMAGTGGNTSSVPYQLYQSAAGTIWGNTATSTGVGNGVGGAGNGSAQSMKVYAIAPGSDFKPDTYSDIVTINVNY